MIPLLCLPLLMGPVSDGGEKKCSPLEIVVKSHNNCEPHAEPYIPQPGDLVLFSHRNPIYHLMYVVALKGGGVTHVGMIVADPNGKPVLLEAPFCQPVSMTDLAERMDSYHGKFLIRRCKSPLSEEQNAELTAFACAQVGKPYYPHDMIVPIFCGPVRWNTKSCKPPKDFNRSGWICSSLVASACASCGLLDPCIVRPYTTNACDFYIDRQLDLRLGWERPAPLRKACTQVIEIAP